MRRRNTTCWQRSAECSRLLRRWCQLGGGKGSDGVDQTAKDMLTAVRFPEGISARTRSRLSLHHGPVKTGVVKTLVRRGGPLDAYTAEDGAAAKMQQDSLDPEAPCVRLQSILDSSNAIK